MRRLNTCRAKYKLGNAQISPPINADSASSRFTANKIQAMQMVANHCAVSMRFTYGGIVNLRTNLILIRLGSTATTC